MSLFHFELEWPGGGMSFTRECLDAEAAVYLARWKCRNHKGATWEVTERPAVAANDTALDAGPWPTPAGPSLEHAFAPGSPEWFADCEREAREEVRKAQPERHTWGAGL